MRLDLIGRHAHHKGNIKHVGTWSQAISSNFSCAMDLDYCLRWLLTAPLQGINALWVHPFRLSSHRFLTAASVPVTLTPQLNSADELIL